MKDFGDQDTKSMGKGGNQVDGGLVNQGARSDATQNMAVNGFEGMTTRAPVLAHSISRDCGGLLEGNSGVDTSGWYETDPRKSGGYRAPEGATGGGIDGRTETHSKSFRGPEHTDGLSGTASKRDIG